MPTTTLDVTPLAIGKTDFRGLTDQASGAGDRLACLTLGFQRDLDTAVVVFSGAGDISHPAWRLRTLNTSRMRSAEYSADTPPEDATL